MIDFTNCKELPGDYGGSEQKKKLVYNGEAYLVKFPDPVRQVSAADEPDLTA